jgi:hypothetical protein
MKTLWIVAKILPLLAGTFALLMLGLLFHKTSLDIGPLASNLGATLAALTQELEAAHQVTGHADDIVSYEAQQIRKPQPLVFKILRGIGIGLGAAAKL